MVAVMIHRYFLVAGELDVAHEAGNCVVPARKA